MRLNYMRLIEITRTILISFLFLKLTSCDFYSDYHKVVKSEISKGQINNNLILGFSLGMTKQQYQIIIYLSF